jgi:hypothetical protein
MTKNLWIIGELTPEVPEGLFPTQKRILQTYFYLCDVDKKTFSQSISIVAECRPYAATID